MSRRRRSQYTLGNVPLIFHSRSRFDLSYSHKSTGNVGDLLPLYVQEINPGDSFKCDASVVCRVSSSFLKPVMDNLFCDVMFFFVPSRTVFDKWAEIFGENNESDWARQTSVSAPTVPASTSPYVIASGDLANYIGVPIGVSSDNLRADGNLNLLPFRAYAKIYNEWYRDENLIDPMLIETGSSVLREALNGNAFSANNYTGKVAKVSKLHDYFTSLLPSPQKGDSVQISPVGTFPDVPVVTFSGSNSPTGQNLLYQSVTGWSGSSSHSLFGTVQGPSSLVGLYGLNAPLAPSAGEGLEPANLQALTSSLSVDSISVNDLRLAFQTQKLLERDAIYGTRYTELLRSHWGVSSPDARLQRSEFLGGRRFPLSILQTVQTSSATNDSPLGNVGAWSLTNGRAGYTKGFTEHGFVIGMFCVRQFHTYQQGVERFLWRKNRLDYPDPLFQSIGYQPVFTKEIYAKVGNADTVLGYAPSYEDCRSRQNRVSGMLSSDANEGLDVWHFSDYYSNAPVLGKQFIEELPDYVSRTLSVEEGTVDQFIFDVYFKQSAVRVLSTYGEPGLIDHH